MAPAPEAGLRRPWHAILCALAAAAWCAIANAGETQQHIRDSSVCSTKHFQCRDSQCLPLSYVCDGEIDCVDGTDENPDVCKGLRTCEPTEFRCGNGRCIPGKWVCDQQKDCADGADESQALCRNRTVNCTGQDVFKCQDGGCIPIAWICDGIRECVDGSDEKKCEVKNCTTEEFTCRKTPGECIPLTWMCDDTPDCSDESDEKACNETCRSDQFTCTNGKCIQQHWKCDADSDCEDGSDEVNCTYICLASEFSCKNHICINAKYKCDGMKDCVGGEDELDCPNTTKPINLCSANEFQCKSDSTCIHNYSMCDGFKDCIDGSDEHPSICQNITCRPDQVQCKDKSCIPGLLYCDGKPDCPDGSDELNCVAPSINRKCNISFEFDCGGGMCIPYSKVCDKKPDCPNFSDEPKTGCFQNECEQNNGGCSQNCVDTPSGYYCSCRPGYALKEGSNTTCEDINECNIPGSCSQICINEKGTYKCECHKDYERDHRHPTRCRASEGHASLLFARRFDIRKIMLDHPDMTEIVNNTKAATALDFIFRTGMIYWSDISDHKIYKAPIDEGYDRTVVISDRTITADGLAIDWIYNHLYWTDTARNTIELSNLEGNMRKVLIEDRLEEPRAIALNPLEGWMFWTDWGSPPKIERAGMDGSHRQTIVSYEIKWPNGLTLDYVQKRIYWVDAKLNSISSCRYDGSDRRNILYSFSYLQHPFSITTFEDWVYWTDWEKAAVFRANKFTGADVKAVTAVRMVYHPMAIHVYHPYRQPSGTNHCASVNGHCSHLCLPAPQVGPKAPKISCACPEGLRLMPDGQMCVENEPEKSVTIEPTSTIGVPNEVITSTDRHEIPLDPALLIASSPFDYKLYGSSFYNIMKPGRLSDMFANIFKNLVSSVADEKKKDEVAVLDRNISDLNLPKGIYWANHKNLKPHNDYYDMFYTEENPLPDLNIWEEEDGKTSNFNYDEIKQIYVPSVEPSLVNAGSDSERNITSIPHDGQDTGVIAGMVIAIVTLVILVVAGIIFLIYRHYLHRNIRSMNFDNPVYRKTTEDQFSLEKNGYAPGSKSYPSTIGEEAREPLNTKSESGYPEFNEAV